MKRTLKADDIYILVRGKNSFTLRKMPDEHFFALNRGLIVEKDISLMDAVEKVRGAGGVLYVNTVSSCRDAMEREIAVGTLKDNIKKRVVLLTEKKMEEVRRIQECEYAYLLDDVAV